MNVYTNIKFKGHYPVGTAAVVVAESKEHAAELLSEALRPSGLGADVEAKDFVVVDHTVSHVAMLRDGDY